MTRKVFIVLLTGMFCLSFTMAAYGQTRSRPRRPRPPAPAPPPPQLVPPSPTGDYNPNQPPAPPPFLAMGKIGDMPSGGDTSVLPLGGGPSQMNFGLGGQDSATITVPGRSNYAPAGTTGLQVSTDGGKNYSAYKKPLVFDRAQRVDLRVRRGGSGMPINKTLSVIARLPGIKSVPSLDRGMVRSRYLLMTKAGFDHEGSHTGNHGKQHIKHPRNEKKDLFLLPSSAQPEEIVAVHEMLPDDVGGVVRQYTGYWWAPAEGVYTFTMENEG